MSSRGAVKSYSILIRNLAPWQVIQLCDASYPLPKIT